MIEHVVRVLIAPRAYRHYIVAAVAAGEPLPQYDVGCLLTIDADLQVTAAETLDLLIKFGKRHVLIGSNELESFSAIGLIVLGLSRAIFGS
jgi:hypothetical protein